MSQSPVMPSPSESTGSQAIQSCAFAAVSESSVFTALVLVHAF